jgi:hypothetical protein
MPNTQYSIDFWKQVATEFKNADGVIFDLFNEPYPGNNARDNADAWDCWLKGTAGGKCFGIAYEVAGMQALVDAVRSTDAKNLIMLGGLQYSNDMSQFLTHRPVDKFSNYAAAIHTYNFNYCKTQACWDQYYAPVAAALPLIAGEFGQNDALGTFVTPLVAWFQSKNIHYIAWEWNTADQKAGPAVISNYDGTCTVDFGCSVKRIFTNSNAPTAVPPPDSGSDATSCTKTTPSSENCAPNPNCCEAGKQCYEKNAYWASCQPSCIPGKPQAFDGNTDTWTCNLLSITTTVPSTTTTRVTSTAPVVVPSSSTSSTAPPLQSTSTAASSTKAPNYPPAGNPSSANPFERTTSYYVNPTYKALLQSSIDSASGAVKSYLTNMKESPSAYWIDVMSKVTGSDTGSMEGILADASKKSKKQLVVFMVYDLPNRDCHAKASNGEICCTYNNDGSCNYDAGGDCVEGITKYKTQYIDPMFNVLSKYHNAVEIVLVIEPDSLPNFATNLGKGGRRKAYTYLSLSLFICLHYFLLILI